MAVFVPIPIKKTSYSMKEDGLHIFVVYSKFTVYLLTWIAFFILAMILSGYQGLNAYSNLMSGILSIIPSILISTALTIVILFFGIFRLQRIQKLFHKEKFIPWNLIERGELKKVGGAKVKFFLKPDNKLSIEEKTVEFSITKGNEDNIERFLSAILSDRLIVGEITKGNFDHVLSVMPSDRQIATEEEKKWTTDEGGFRYNKVKITVPATEEITKWILDEGSFRYKKVKIKVPREVYADRKYRKRMKEAKTVNEVESVVSEYYDQHPQKT